MPYNIILYFCLPYFHVSNCALFSTLYFSTLILYRHSLDTFYPTHLLLTFRHLPQIKRCAPAAFITGNLSVTWLLPGHDLVPGVIQERASQHWVLSQCLEPQKGESYEAPLCIIGPFVWTISLSAYKCIINCCVVNPASITDFSVKWIHIRVPSQRYLCLCVGKPTSTLSITGYSMWQVCCTFSALMFPLGSESMVSIPITVPLWGESLSLHYWPHGWWFTTQRASNIDLDNFFATNSNK